LALAVLQKVGVRNPLPILRERALAHELEAGNALKRRYADLALGNIALKDLIEK
jgi:hypothetical protein